jgi:hypothetical protein
MTQVESLLAQIDAQGGKRKAVGGGAEKKSTGGPVKKQKYC